MITTNWILKHDVHGEHPWAVQAAALEARAASGRSRYGYWLEQGLGKTALVLNEWVLSETPLLVVVCPNSFKADWCAAPEEWGIKNVHTSMSPSPPAVRNQRNLYAINYEAVRRGFTLHGALERIIECTPTFLVIDESSFIKNDTTENYKSVRELCKRAKHVRLLNGTPQTQNILDWFPQLKCLGEFDGMKSTVFRARFARRGGYMGRQIVGVREENLPELETVVKQSGFRALKADWRKDLPPQNDNLVRLQMTKQQQIHYDEMMDDFFTHVDGLDVPAQMVLTQMDKLRQISSCVAMHKGETRIIAKENDNPKLKALHDIIAGGDTKVIVVYTYRASGEAIFNTLYKAKLFPTWLKGGMDPLTLSAEKHLFNTDPTYRVMVAQQSAACMGHTLISGSGKNRCSRMVFYESSFSYRDWVQMRDRIHRGEQDLPCDYYYLVTSPMDHGVINSLISRQNEAQMVDTLIKIAREHARR